MSCHCLLPPCLEHPARVQPVSSWAGGARPSVAPAALETLCEGEGEEAR